MTACHSNQSGRLSDSKRVIRPLTRRTGYSTPVSFCRHCSALSLHFLEQLGEQIGGAPPCLASCGSAGIAGHEPADSGKFCAQPASNTISGSSISLGLFKFFMGFFPVFVSGSLPALVFGQHSQGGTPVALGNLGPVTAVCAPLLCQSDTRAAEAELLHPANQGDQHEATHGHPGPGRDQLQPAAHRTTSIALA